MNPTSCPGRSWISLATFLGCLASATAASSLYEMLFPSNYTYSDGFTTAAIDVNGELEQVDLAASDLNIVHGTPPESMNYAEKTAWQAVYPEGAYSGVGIKEGWSFYVNGSDEFTSACAAGAKEVVVGYSVFFEKDFMFQKGGKIPGGYGGVGGLARGCSGGRQTNRDDGFDLRLMWRTNGTGELYTYLPLTAQNKAAQLAVPGTIANPIDGYSVGRGAFTFPTGEWVAVSEYIKLNQPPSEYNGEVKVFINGNLVIDLTGVALVMSEDATFQGMQWQTFFGGSTAGYASPQNQSAWFADVSGAIVKSISA